MRTHGSPRTIAESLALTITELGHVELRKLARRAARRGHGETLALIRAEFRHRNRHRIQAAA